jgi:hypothetical protein
MAPIENQHRRKDDYQGDNFECCPGLIRVQDGYDRNKEKIEREIKERQDAVNEIWKGFNDLKKMIMTAEGTVILAATVWIASVVAHIFKIGP